MRNGISVYAGLGYGIGENISLIEKAASLGLSRLFTSAQIPESAADGEKFLDEFAMILAAGIENNFEIIIDVNPENIFNFDLDGLTLRLDDGFDAEKVIELSNARKIQLNASTVTKEFLTALKYGGANLENIEALHNFYPHPHTGLDSYFFENQNKIFHDFGISSGAFIPSLNKPRLPLCEGLPTVEDCRNFSTDLSARFLAALGTDFIIIGDGLPSDEDLSALAKIVDDEVIMQAKILTEDETSQKILQNKFTRRPDVSKSVIRAVEGRQILKQLGGTIKADNSPTERTFGDVTIDNENFGRYVGEVQIVENILPPDERVNTVATILDEENFLTGYIKPRQKFSFRWVKSGDFGNEV